MTHDLRWNMVFTLPQKITENGILGSGDVGGSFVIGLCWCSPCRPYLLRFILFPLFSPLTSLVFSSLALHFPAFSGGFKYRPTLLRFASTPLSSPTNDFCKNDTLGSIKRGGLVATRNTSPHHRHQQHNHHHHHHRHHDQHHRPPPPPCPLRGHLHLWTVLLSCLSIVRFVCIGGCIGLVRLHWHFLVQTYICFGDDESVTSTVSKQYERCLQSCGVGRHHVFTFWFYPFWCKRGWHFGTLMTLWSHSLLSLTISMLSSEMKFETATES